MRTRLLTLSIVGLAAAISCGPEAPTAAQPPPPPPPPGGGTAIVSLTTPNSDDGALLFELTGPATIHVNPPPSGSVKFFIDSSAATIRVVAAGSVHTGPLLTFTVADTTTLSSYSATVKDVASRQNVLRQSLAGYELKITH